ncbi:hypothetical protein KGF54_001311 [Candida jiufengensis]|uniref:uncharacterized protein n=1 Tax=Candida jiufengensis TaxID=497108 RepID=UPI002224A9B5|nr:uncharacterized protein KGF54_001311 [Candida jiufengensis]KAI5955809.1 hypothetical protein KGF54_001311 [Candida jiufengensis]
MPDNIPSISLQPPETPRCKHNNNINSNTNNQILQQSINRTTTPSFSFGLSFSPTFNFNSPNILSPRKFLTSTTDNNLNKVINHKRSISNSSGKDYNRFLESLNKSLDKEDSLENTPKDGLEKESQDIEEDNEDTDHDIWSSLNNSTQQNNTNLSSIYEDDNKENNIPYNTQNSKIVNDKFDEFLTPNKLLLSNKKPSATTTITTTTIATATPSLEVAPEISPKNSEISIDEQDHENDHLSSVIKKRKINHSITDTPNNAIASKIDKSMVSPLTFRKPSVTNSITSNSNSSSNVNLTEDKVWNPDLDDILIKSLYKYRKFKEDPNLNNNSILKNTSQNKVISRMLFNKTGILRSTKQISSRIFRLSKSGKLIKDIKTPLTNGSTSELDDVFNSNESFLLHPGSIDSNRNNALIDRELDILLSSSPLDEVFDEQTNYLLNLTDFKICSKARDNTTIFTKLATWNTCHNNIINKLDDYMIKILKERNIPIWFINHDINLNINHIETSTPMSAISPTFTNHNANLNHANFQSTMSINVYCKGSSSESMLNWCSLIEVYKNGKKILNVTDIINGYFNEDSKCYILQVPFIKTFFAGFFNYLINGSLISSEENIKIIQYIYNNEESDNNSNFDLKNSKIFAYLVHEFNMMGTKGQTKVVVVNSLRDHINKYEPTTDDNETVLADSSPYKSSNSPNHSLKNFETPSKNKFNTINNKNLKIDLSKTNNLNMNIPAGPMTAPIYNSNGLNQNNFANFNQFSINNLRQQQQHQQQFQNFNLNQTPQHPGMNIHALSTNNIPQMVSTEQNVFNTQQSQQQQPQQQQLSFNQSPTNLTTNATLSNAQSSFVSPINQQSKQQVQLQMEMELQMSLQMQLQMQQQQQQQQNLINQPMYNADVVNEQFIRQRQLFYQSQAQQQSQHAQQQITQFPKPIKQDQSKKFHQSQVISSRKNSNTSSTSKNQSQSKDSLKPKEITFGPIIGYDPSKDLKQHQQQQQQQQAQQSQNSNNHSSSTTKSNNQNVMMGIHRFPLNTPVMYKPKK